MMTILENELRSRISVLDDKIEALEKENFSLAAYQCPHAVSSETGDMVCTKIAAQAAEIEQLNTEYSNRIGELLTEIEQLKE